MKRLLAVIVSALLVFGALASAGCATAGDPGDVAPGGDASMAEASNIGDAHRPPPDDTAHDAVLIFEVEGDDTAPFDGSSLDAPGCPAGKIACGGACVDLGSDPANCGVCARACGSGEVCSAGTCSSICAPPTTKCGALCIDLTKDSSNCGACGKACGAGESCLSSVCTLTCGGGTTKCGSACVDLAKDSANCGSCGHACAGAMVCSAGACEVVCGGGTTKCGSSCVDLTKDSANCGSCGHACATGESCSGSSCLLVCSSPTSKCGGVCVDTSSDNANCGACGAVCGACTTCSSGGCRATTTPFTFPTSSSQTIDGTLGGGGGGRYWHAGDFVQQALSRSVCANGIDLDFTMSDFTDDSGCSVGTLHFNVIVNGVGVGSYAFPGGTSYGSGTSWAIKGTIPFPSSIAPSSGQFTVRIQAVETVCTFGGAWDWVAGGTVTLH